jgi:hypothetical protein
MVTDELFDRIDKLVLKDLACGLLGSFSVLGTLEHLR